MKKRLIKIDNKTSCSLVSIVMCLLTLFAIAISIKNGIFRDAMYMVRIIYLISLIFLTLLSGYVFFRENFIGARGDISPLLINAFVSIFFAALTYSIYGLPEHRSTIATLAGLNYFFFRKLFSDLMALSEEIS